MKKELIILGALLFSCTSFAKIISMEVPIELNKLKAEYYASSQRGEITLIGCHKCEKQRYPFSNSVQIKRNGIDISLDEFLQDYWNAKYPTVFLNLEKTEIIRIIY